MAFIPTLIGNNKKPDCTVRDGEYQRLSRRIHVREREKTINYIRPQNVKNVQECMDHSYRTLLIY